MPKPNKQRLADHRKSREAQGMHRAEFWLAGKAKSKKAAQAKLEAQAAIDLINNKYIDSYVDSKANRRELIDTTPIDDIERCDKTLEMFDED